MSAPDTNLEKQERRHKAPLIGIALAVIIAVVLGIIFLAEGGDEVTGAPEGAGGVVLEEQ